MESHFLATAMYNSVVLVDTGISSIQKMEFFCHGLVANYTDNEI